MRFVPSSHCDREGGCGRGEFFATGREELRKNANSRRRSWFRQRRAHYRQLLQWLEWSPGIGHRSCHPSDVEWLKRLAGRFESCCLRRPTSTPATSVMELSGPGAPSKGMPRSRERGFGLGGEADSWASRSGGKKRRELSRRLLLLVRGSQSRSYRTPLLIAVSLRSSASPAILHRSIKSSWAPI